MAKVIGALHSDWASGQFANVLVFANWKGRLYVRYKAYPSNPQSDLQTIQRTKFENGVADWHSQDEATQDSWTARAKELGYVMSGFNFFVQQYIMQGSSPVMP